MYIYRFRVGHVGKITSPLCKPEDDHDTFLTLYITHILFLKYMFKIQKQSESIILLGSNSWCF